MRAGGGGEQKVFFRVILSSFVQKWWVDENDSVDNCAAWACFPCIAIAEGGLAAVQIARKQASNTDI